MTGRLATSLVFGNITPLGGGKEFHTPGEALFFLSPRAAHHARTLRKRATKGAAFPAHAGRRKQKANFALI